jgi:hypothetical protein
MGKIKKGFLFSILFFLLLVHPGFTAIVPVSVTFTTDNMLNAWYSLSGNSVQQLNYIMDDPQNWMTPMTANLNLTVGQQYSIIWQVSNWGPGSDSNPAGFLAQISPSSSLNPVNINLSSPSWQVSTIPTGFSYSASSFNSLAWVAATSYGTNSSNTIWYSANNNSPITGISPDAQWIWTSNNFNQEPGLPIFIKASFTVVPIPAAAWMLGAGLVGLVAIRRKFPVEIFNKNTDRRK